MIRQITAGKPFYLAAFLLAFIALFPVRSTSAQEIANADSQSKLVLTLDEAIVVALVENTALENVRLDQELTNSQIKEGWAELFPSVDFNSSYTRNVRSANPFAGSDAGGLFETLGFLNWIAFNEQARTDNDAGTDPISIGDYFQRIQQGYENAGIVRNTSDNPFSVPNVYMNSLSIVQKVFDGRAIFGAYGASKWLKPFNEYAVTREEHRLINQVKSAWYAILLLKEQENVLVQSVARSSRTLDEVSRQVAQGVAPKFQRLSAEVELANQETQLVQAQTNSAAAIDNLKILLAVPPQVEMELRGTLEGSVDGSMVTTSLADAALAALEKRPDLAQSRISIELERIQLQVAKVEFLPSIDAFANFGYMGNVPDARSVISSSAADPFSFTKSNRGYFDTAYWDRTTNIGFRLKWNLFNGLASKQHVQQRKIAIQKAENNVEFLARSIQVEVEQSLRNLRAAQTRMLSQQKNVERAELNFEYAESRLKEGVATPLEVRETSNQLDQSKLGYLQAVHDYLVARSAYQTAIGAPDNYLALSKNAQ
ncbi:MAG: TolC family protein [Bacteroidetes bacterium]|nr:TolC family protein [Bacteroidota bacterium]